MQGYPEMGFLTSFKPSQLSRLPTRTYRTGHSNPRGPGPLQTRVSLEKVECYFLKEISLTFYFFEKLKVGFPVVVLKMEFLLWP
jgi:hypothetical protein